MKRNKPRVTDCDQRMHAVEKRLHWKELYLNLELDEVEEQ
jgi:hypothetical protein